MPKTPIYKPKFVSFSKKRRPFQKMEKERKILILATALASVFLFFLIIGSIFSMIVFAYYSKDLPSPTKLSTREVSLSTKIFDRNGKLLYDIYGEENRTLVTLDEVSPQMIKATLATEDADFYKHQGFDIPGILRAIFNIVFRGELQGGSTITQQLVKNALLSPERTLTRKVKEFVLALQIEKKYTKDEILQMFLNEAPYGGQAWGVEAASEMYFGKKAQDLTLAEATLLAGLPQKPSVYSPFGAHPENAKKRQTYVLHLMRTRGWLSKDGHYYYLSAEEGELAKNEKLVYASFGQSIKAPHFVMYVKGILEERYGEKMVEQGGLQVTTTLDLEMQETAQKIVAEEIEKAKGFLVGNGALIALDPRNGQILAMVGSKDYFASDYDGKVNVTLSSRQPGSAIKPITYATAFKQGYTPATLLFDVPTEFPGGVNQPLYKPQNYDGKFRGPIQLRYALGNSINLIAVKLLKLVGIPSMLETAHKMGITTLNEPERYGLSLTLGGGEVKLLDMAVVSSTLATGGIRHDPVAILKVTDSKGNVLEEFKETPGRRVLKEEHAFLVSDILADNEARTEIFGTRSPLFIPGHTVAVKTGTTDDKRDNWTIGYTPFLTVGVWVGNNDNTPMHPRLASGITGAAPIWHRAIVEFLKDKKDEPFKKPENIVEVEVCKLSGELPHGNCEKRVEKFVEGTEPFEGCSVHKNLRVCTTDGKLATEICEWAGKAEDRTFVSFKARLSEWQSFLDRWIEETYSNDQLYYPPEGESETYFDHSKNPIEKGGGPLVLINSPSDGDDVGFEFKVSAKVTSPFTITKVEFFLDGVLMGTKTSIPYEKKFNLGEEMEGEHEIKVQATDADGGIGDNVITVNIGG